MAGTAQKLIRELEVRFPSASLIDAFGLVYPQYWMGATADEDFERHLDVLKEHYGHTMEFTMELDEQATMFKVAMKGNYHATVQGDLPLNPLTHLWHHIEANGLLWQKLSEYLKIAELTVVTILGIVEDERTFNTLNFMKNKLRNRLSTHLPAVVGMHAQDFFSLSDFPYNAAYKEWRSKSRKED